MNDHEEDASRDNVVSLERVRERRMHPGEAKRPSSSSTTAAMEAAPAAATQAAAAHSDAGGANAAESPLPGRLIWLHCPTCGTLEYTELVVSDGRRHKCGTIVEEAEVEIDVRAEMTVAEINLRRVAALEGYLRQQRARFEEYRHRLTLIAGATPKPYALTEERVKALPAAEVDPVGLIISEALHNPSKRFGKKE